MPIQFWFSIGSTYSYLTVMRLADVAAEAGVAFEYRPFSVRAIMREMNNIPFAEKTGQDAVYCGGISNAGPGATECRFPCPAPYPLAGF